MKYSQIIILLTLVKTVIGSFDCLCSYAVENNVYLHPHGASQKTGVLYEFDCKEILQDISVPKSWAPIAFNHQVGYVQIDNSIGFNVCPGDIPVHDKLTTTTHQVPVTTSKQTTDVSSDPETTVPTSIVSSSTMQPVDESTLSITSTPFMFTTTTQPLSSTKPTSNTTQSVVTTTEETTSPTTTSTTPSSTMPVTTLPPSTVPTTDATKFCPQNVQQSVIGDDGVLIVDMSDNKCFELVESHTSWEQAVKHCHDLGGEIVTVKSLTLNRLLHEYILINYKHKTWIGLSDVNTDGQFTWSSGEPVSYTNWINGNAASSTSIGHCIVIEPTTGMWQGENCIWSYPYVCEFDISRDHPAIG
ncbi:hypothetical protein ACF0H5_019687 [Mactra antiquata]